MKFRSYLRSIEEDYKPKSSTPNLFTYTGKMLVEREKYPVITKETITNADILLYNLSYVLDFQKTGYDVYWFPTSYIYAKEVNTQWIKLKSKKYCEKILPMFGVNTVGELKEIIINHPPSKEIRYNGSFDFAPTIKSSIKIDEIATLN